MGCSFFNSMGAFIRNILAFVLALYWPLHSIHRLLPIAHCTLQIVPSAPKRNSPAQAPSIAYGIANTVCPGACVGERSRRGRPPRDRPLLKRRVPPRSFPYGGNLLRRGPPRSFPPANIHCAAFTMAANFSGIREAPPIRPPSTLTLESSSAAFFSFIEPPY